jgi:hypothetical protein
LTAGRATANGNWSLSLVGAGNNHRWDSVKAPVARELPLGERPRDWANDTSEVGLSLAPHAGQSSDVPHAGQSSDVPHASQSSDVPHAGQSSDVLEASNFAVAQRPLHPRQRG